MIKTYIFILNCLLLATIVSKETRAGDPLFPNSVVSNDIDFILGTDSDAFTSLTYIGKADKEMPDSRNDILFDVNTYVFEANFSNGKKIGIWCHSSFGSQAAAQGYADKLCPRLGKLPEVQRDMLDHVVIHKGDAGAYAETEGHFFVLYSDNVDARISTHDLEETVFHESVHASIQDSYENTSAWTSAQSADPSFVTEYAERLPNLEDMPETALFAYTMIKHPGRLSDDIENWLNDNIPNRLAFFRTIYTAGGTTEVFELKTQTATYPNPTNGKLTVMLEEAELGSRLNFYSITGVLVKSVSAEQGQNEIDLGDLSNGVYLLTAPSYQLTRIIKQ